MDETAKMDKASHLKLVEAWWDGELEVTTRGGWMNPCSPPPVLCDPKNYRIRPKPTLRPWKPEEVPLGAQVRYAGNTHPIRMLILCNLGENLLGQGKRWTVVDLFGSMEHSLDGGRTWKPCATEESQ